MALLERQAKAVLMLFVNSFASSNPNNRRTVYEEFVDSFGGSIEPWENLSRKLLLMKIYHRR